MGDAPSSHSFRRSGCVATLQNAESAAASHGTFWRRENFRCHALQLVRHAMKAFRMAEKQIPIGGQIFSQAVDYFYLHIPLKINEHVTAENQVKWAGNAIRFLCEIEPLESNDVPKFLNRFDL